VSQLLGKLYKKKQKAGGNYVHYERVSTMKISSSLVNNFFQPETHVH